GTYFGARAFLCVTKWSERSSEESGCVLGCENGKISPPVSVEVVLCAPLASFEKLDLSFIFEVVGRHAVRCRLLTVRLLEADEPYLVTGFFLYSVANEFLSYRRRRRG